MIKLLVTFLTLIFMSNTSFAAIFDKASNSNGPKLLLAEVKGYGENELKPEFFANFREQLGEQLQDSGVFQVELRLSDGANMDLDQQSPEDKLFSIIHMDAIAHSHLYRREFASSQMIRYGDSIMGKKYYQDDEQTARRMKQEGMPYFLTTNVITMVNELGQKYNADYMLFVNLRDADVFRKTGGIFSTHTTQDDVIKSMLGKRVTVDMEYYLVNTKTGKVFEGQNAQKKTAVITNALIVKNGVKTSAAQLLHDILGNQAQQIVKLVTTKGLRAVGNN